MVLLPTQPPLGHYGGKDDESAGLAILPPPIALNQGFSNFFDVGITFSSQNSSADHLILVSFQDKINIFAWEAHQLTLTEEPVT